MTEKEAREILIDFQKYRRAKKPYHEIGSIPKYSGYEIWQAIDYFLNK